MDLLESKGWHSNLRGSKPLLPQNMNNSLLVLRPQVPIELSSDLISIVCLISIVSTSCQSFRKFFFDSHLLPHKKQFIFDSKILASFVDLHSIFSLPWVLNLRLLFYNFLHFSWSLTWILLFFFSSRWWVVSSSCLSLLYFKRPSNPLSFTNTKGLSVCLQIAHSTSTVVIF